MPVYQQEDKKAIETWVGPNGTCYDVPYGALEQDSGALKN